MTHRFWIGSLTCFFLLTGWFSWPYSHQEVSAISSTRQSLPLIDIPVEEQSLLPLIASIFEIAAKGEIDAAVQQFSSRSWRSNERAIAQLRTILTNLNNVAEGYSGTELVAVRRVSPRYTEVWTISWFEPGPYLFKARFYLKDGQWRFADFAGTNEMNKIVEKAPLTFVAQYKMP